MFSAAEVPDGPLIIMYDQITSVYFHIIIHFTKKRSSLLPRGKAQYEQFKMAGDRYCICESQETRFKMPD